MMTALGPCFGLFVVIYPYSAQQRRYGVHLLLSPAFLFLGLARIHLLRRTQSRNERLHER